MKRPVALADAEDFTFLTQDGEVIPGSVLLTAHGDAVEHILMPILTPSMILNALNSSFLGRRWVNDRHIWRKMVQRDFPGLFTTAYNSNQPHQMYPTFVSYLDRLAAVEKRQQNMWLKMYETATKNNTLTAEFQSLTPFMTFALNSIVFVPTKPRENVMCVVALTATAPSRKTFLHNGEHVYYAAQELCVNRFSDVVSKSFAPIQTQSVVLSKALLGDMQEVAVDTMVHNPAFFGFFLVRYDGSVSLYTHRMRGEAALVNCQYCGSPAPSYRCGGCHEVSYCGSECHRQDWDQRHQWECQGL